MTLAKLGQLWMSSCGQAYGVDHSEVMVRQASRRNAAAIRAQRVMLLRAPADRLPRFAEPLDAIVAVNSAGFWPSPAGRTDRARQPAPLRRRHR
jgi:hypothetical protein